MSTIWFVYSTNYVKNSILDLEGHGVFVAKIPQTLMSQIFLN